MSSAVETLLSPAELGSKDWSKDIYAFEPEENLPSIISNVVTKEKFSDLYISSSDFNYYGYNPQTVGWGGTYHCFQTLYSSLLKFPTIKAHLAAVWMDSVPSILAIQLKLEEAWKAGFDPDGAGFFQSTVFNTKKKIGATEIWTLFQFLQISCKIIDFPQDPRKAIDWIIEYYTKEFDRIMRTLVASSVADDKDSIKSATSSELVLDLKDGNPKTFIAPLYLQGEGTSSLAFAIEGEINRRNVLIADASLQGKLPQLTTAAALVTPLRANKGNINTFVGSQCQILLVDTLTTIPDSKKGLVKYAFGDLVL